MFIVSILILSLCSCKNEIGVEVVPLTDSTETDTISTGINDNTKENDITSAEADNISVEVDATETLYEKLLREIDSAYHEDQGKPENGTTLGMVDLADKYTEKWKQVADKYYNEIMNYNGISQIDENSYSSDDLHTFVSNMKINWEEYNQKQCENYLKTLKAIYGSGTIGRTIFADYKYEMQKEWALQLVGIYQQLNIK